MKLKRFAILNGTSNYILSNMSKLKISFDEALKDAQDKGYAESDPTLISMVKTLLINYQF